MKEKIKFYREKRNMSKSELARQINVSPSYITMLENGEKTNPSMEILLKISNVLNIDIAELSDIDDNLYKLLKENTVNLTDSDIDKSDSYIDFIMGVPELKPLITIFRNKGYELRQDIKGYDINLLKEGKIIAQIPEKDFIKEGKRMLYVINEFTDFEFSKLFDTFNFLY